MEVSGNVTQPATGHGPYQDERNQSSNSTDEDDYDNYDADAADYARRVLDTVSLVIYCLAFVVGTVGNGLVIYVTGCRMKRTVNSVWFLNLALADFLFTAFLLFSIVYVSRDYRWPFGDFLCKLNGLVTAVNMFASVFLLTAISLDRCLATWVVVWAQNRRTPRKAQVACVAVWLSALACSLPFAVFRETQDWYGPSAVRTICRYSYSDATHRHLVAFRFLVGFLVPFLVIVGCHVAITTRARRLQRGRRSCRSLRIVVAIILAFFLCWVPYHVFQFLGFLTQGDGADPALVLAEQIGVPLSSSLAFLNSCLNPVLYVFMCNEFQRKLRQCGLLLVFESAFAEDHLSFASSARSLSSQLSRISSSRKYSEGTLAPGEGKDAVTATSLIST